MIKIDSASDFWRRSTERIFRQLRRDSQLRQLIPERAVNERMWQPDRSDQELIAELLAGYESRPALGERSYLIAREKETGRHTKRFLAEFTTITYSELRRRVEALANAWRHHASHGLGKGDFVVTLGFTGIDLTVTELACVYARAVAVPLQASLPLDELARIVDDVAPPALVAETRYLDVAVSLASECSTVRTIVLLNCDVRDDDDLDRLNAAKTRLANLGSRVSLVTLNSLLAYGAQLEWTPWPADPLGEERSAALIYTSGATGKPKGAIFPERVTKQYWVPARGYIPRITVSYAPIDHMMGRNSLFSTLSHGGTVYFTAMSDLSSLLEDIRIVRPTYLIFIPRLAQIIYQYYRSEVRRRSANRSDNPDGVRTQVLLEMRATYLGDRLTRGMVGGAPTAPEIVKFIRDCFDFPLLEGYGSTESGGITGDNRILNPQETTYKLRDVADLGYRTTDKPFPRGELMIKTRTQISGYFKDPEATAQLFDSEGFVATRDIVEERGPGNLVWLDRTDDVLKLPQGEYVALGALQSLFESHSSVVKQIFLYGSSVRPYLLAVVVPDMNAARSLIGRVPTERELQDILRGALVRVGHKQGLRRFEIPRLAIVETEDFSIENGLLSNLGKYRARNLRLKYGERLEKIYARMEEGRAERIEAVQKGDPSVNILQRVRQALAAHLGLDNLDPSDPKNFSDLGGDSLGAVSFASLLEKMFGVALPVSAILSPAGNAVTWARDIEALLAAEERQSTRTSADIHGMARRVLHARDLRLESFVDLPAVKAPPLPAAAHGRAKTVLLTGATGYLGRFLCLEWLERIAGEGGKLICLIRASNKQEAGFRLEKTFEDAGPSIRHRVLACQTHLEVMAGDICKARLGLADLEYDRLAVEVDRIVHAAAMVNHVFSYDNLFAPNVAATATMIGLALSERQKHFDFISSIVVAGLADGDRLGEATAPAARVMLRKSYAAGYTASKWAGEVLLHDAHQRFGLPVRIFRPSMILAHQTARGQINVPDMFTRLLYSIVITGLAPKSFYRSGSRHGSTAHYDGLPVDIVAKAVSGIGEDTPTTPRTYHVSNFHWSDGVSLDSIVDWVVSAGHRVERVPSYPQWISRFEEALRALPHEKRRLSALEILDAFRRPYSGHDGQVDTERFEAHVRNETELEIPHLDEAFVHKCLDDLRRLGMISH